MRHRSLAHHLLAGEIVCQVGQVRSRFDERLLVEGLDGQRGRDYGPIDFPGWVGRVELLDVDLHWVRS